jgi:hypothetical protein
MAQIRESLSDQIGKVERDSALARAAMTLDREKGLAMNQKTTLDMTADAANARAAIRMEMVKMFSDLDKKIAILEYRLNNK